LANYYELTGQGLECSPHQILKNISLSNIIKGYHAKEEKIHREKRGAPVE
jgi:hypothetical protein